MSFPDTNIVLIGSVKFDANVKKIFPFLLYALTLLPEATKILSGRAPVNETLQHIIISESFNGFNEFEFVYQVLRSIGSILSFRRVKF